MNWRSGVRFTAIAVNSLFAMWLIGQKGWWMPVGYLGDAPLILPPALAIIALVLASTDRRGV